MGAGRRSKRRGEKRLRKVRAQPLAATTRALSETTPFFPCPVGPLHFYSLFQPKIKTNYFKISFTHKTTCDHYAARFSGRLCKTGKQRVRICPDNHGAGSRRDDSRRCAQGAAAAPAQGQLAGQHSRLPLLRRRRVAGNNTVQHVLTLKYH
jgi:hypothetical protein